MLKAARAYQQIDKHVHDTYSNRNLSQDEREARARQGLTLIAQTKLDFSQHIARVHGLPIAAGRLGDIKANVEEKLTNLQKTMFRIEDIYKLENSGAVTPEKALAAIDAHIAQFTATFTDGSEFAQQLLNNLRAEVLRVRAEEEQLVSDSRMLHMARYVTYLAFIYLLLYVGSLARAIWRFENKPSLTLSK